MDSTINQRFWEHASRRVCLRVNAGFCLQRFLPIFLALSVLQGCSLLLLRRLELSQNPLWIGYGALLFLALAASIWSSRQRFFSLADGLVHLESRLSLHNRLTTARQGHTSWPPPQQLPVSLRWSRQRLALPPIGAAVFILLAGWIPVHTQQAAPLQPPEEPLAWQEVETWAEILDERDLFEEETLDQWREQVQALREQPAEDWYSHSSLEAGDHLRDTAADSIRQLQNALQKAAYPLSLAQESVEGIPSGLQPLLQEQWLDALSVLSSGAMSLDRDALARLGEVDFNNLENLSQEQIDRLAEMLREGRSACAASQGQCTGEGAEGDGSPCPTCGSAACLGTGGIGRGPGAADLTFAEFPSLLDSQRQEAVSNPDLSRAALGQQLGTTQSEPEVDPDAQARITAAGSAVLTGDGGDAVFHSRLTPAEKRRLQTYFE